MFSAADIERSATVVITHHVKDDRQVDYEQWLSEIIPISKSYNGHLGVQVIRPITDSAVTYTIIIRYETKEHMHAWMQSNDRQELINKVRPLLSVDDRFEMLEGWDFWFTPEGSKALLPTRWKQFLVTWSAIYPLVLLMSFLVGKTFLVLGIQDNLYLRMLLVTCLVVASMVYIVMPRYTHLVHRWLFR
ncbi:antibiotic biosynthesis monooxygenase [Marinomonas lutimaris]|uniref:antibiotic biosynthesis monooxygenase n=1 Tax=Marinomonas lutimaris TaxID=2846746 RepID=UPI001CA530F9|nr:antibiotic biosynthesis monooxygenase [Marinomonas lutimaris]